MSEIFNIDLEEFQRRISKHPVPSSTKDAERVKKKQNQIVKGAMKVFFEKGFHPASIREIAESCHMSMGQLYRYISSKDDILFLVHKQMHKSWIEYLVTAGFNEFDEPVARLTKALKLSFEYLSKNKDLILFIYTESKYLGEAHLRATLDMDNKNVVDLWRKLVAEVKKDALSKSEVDIVANLIAFLGVFLPLRGWNVREASSEQCIQFIINFILKGMELQPNPGNIVEEERDNNGE